jgi:DNA-binding XRE family transcriptional regulator
MESPLIQIREKFGLKKQDLALMLDVSLPTLNRIEAGFTKIPEKCFHGLRELKQDPEKIYEQQLLFIEERKRQILKSLKLGKD